MMQFYFPNALHDFQYSLREQDKICIKLGTKHVTYQKLANLMWKKYISTNSLGSVIFSMSACILQTRT